MKHLPKMACVLPVVFFINTAGAQLPSERPLSNMPQGVTLSSRKANGNNKPLASEAPLPKAVTAAKSKAAHDSARLDALPSESARSVRETVRAAKAAGAKRRRY
jgi:hypothetical protein